jgi:Arc/MetJ-type ribon-helix-helix transcriptional regulator
MSTISVRIDENLKKSMESLNYINWSEILRQAIMKVIQNERQRDMAKAVLLNDQVRKKAPKGFDSVKIIRESREQRFSTPRNTEP